MADELKKEATGIEKRSEMEKKKYSLWRRLILWTVYGVFGLAVFALLVVFSIFRFSHLNRFLLKSYLQKLRSTLKAEIEVGSFSYNIFTGKLELKDFLYKKAVDSESKPFVKAGLVSARLNPVELLGARR